MPNINIDDILRHQTYLARLETQGYDSFIAPSLAQTLRDIRRLLADYDNITSQRQLKAIETAITQIIMQQPGWAALTTELDSLAVYENDFYAKLIATGTTAAAAERVKRLADNTAMVLRQGEAYNTGFFPDFIRQNLGYQAQRVNSIVRTAYEGRISIAEARKAISTFYDNDAALKAETLTRTGYTHYSSVGRRAFANANKDIIEREVPIVTFDSRTSSQCLSISARYQAKGWPVGESPIGYPPWHWRCRSTVAMLAYGQELTGTRASKGDKPGQIPAKTSISEFIRDQSDEFQNELLGKEKADLFRAGKLDIADLADRNLQPLTLKELRARGV